MVGLGHKEAPQVLLSRKRLDWIFLWTNTLQYVIFFLCLSDMFCLSFFTYLIRFLHLLLQYNFVARLLGPRGNSLKRVEASTDCRVLIRGRGSIKDPIQVVTLISLF